MADGSKKTYVRFCVDCGDIIPGAGKCSKRCPKCKGLREIEVRENAKRKARERLAAERAEKSANKIALRNDIRQAEAAGMSYGKWRIHQMLQAQKGL